MNDLVNILDVPTKGTDAYLVYMAGVTADVFLTEAQCQKIASHLAPIFESRGGIKAIEACAGTVKEVLR